MSFPRGTAWAAALGLLSLALVVPVIAQGRPAAPQTPTSTPGANNSSTNQSAPVTSQTLPPASGNGISSPTGANTPASAATPMAALVPPANPASAVPPPVPAAPAANPPSAPSDVPSPSPVQPQVVYNVNPAQPVANNGFLQIQGMQGESVPWSIVVLLTVLTLIPSILLCITPFARLLIVFHFLRQALGLQTTPSNQTLIGLSLILTFFLMQPVGEQIYETAIVPMQSGKINAMAALNLSEAPMRKFMSHYVREKDVALFIELAKEPRPASIDDVSMRVLLPAYILSELKAGFQIGTILFLPFLIVDMVVASITTSVGMLQLPPVVISTPLKLLLFLMVDGWHLLISSLMRSFN
ncbi:MAG: flagellar type III secretion system pore protein FliP [Terracidiphilus sp.]|jgi:flagellar biosynthetic protein FliP